MELVFLQDLLLYLEIICWSLCPNLDQEKKLHVGEVQTGNIDE